MMFKTIYWSYLIVTVSGFLLDDVTTTATSASAALSNTELTKMLLDERVMRHYLTQRIVSLETAFTSLYHKFEAVTSPTNSQTTSADIEHKILKLETGFNASISNVSTLVNNLIHTQLNINNFMAYFDRNLNNISSTVGTILQHQNNMSLAVNDLTINQSFTDLQLESFNRTQTDIRDNLHQIAALQQVNENKYTILNQSINQTNTTQANAKKQQESLNTTLQQLVNQQQAVNDTVTDINSQQHILFTQQSTLNSTLEHLRMQQLVIMSKQSSLNSTLEYVLTKQPFNIAFSQLQDGGWSAWSSWGSCSLTCNGGMRARHRSCDNPAPSLLGQSCIGNSKEFEICNTNNCPSSMVYFTVTSPDGALTPNSYRPLFHKVVGNHGNGYNLTTALFTCPVTGLYQFSLTFFQRSSSVTSCYLFRNGGFIARAATESIDHYASASASVYVHLDKGDTFEVGQCDNWDKVDTGVASIFTGALVMT